MNDQKSITLINDLLSKAAAAEKLGDENNQRVHLERMFKLYDQLSPQAQKTIKIPFYISHRNLGRLYFTSNQFKKALYHLDEAKKLAEFKEESFPNKCNLNRLIVNSKINIGLKINSNPHLKAARDLNNSLLIKMEKIELKSLKDEIISDKLFLDGIDNDDIKTIIKFEIPSPLPMKENYPIKFKFDGIDHILNIDIVKNPVPIVKEMGIGFVEITEDKYGIVNNSKISLTIFKYIDPKEKVEIKTFSKKKFLLKTLLETIKALNYFIERYRILTGNYWVETIFYKMIKRFSCEIIIGGQTFRSLPDNIDHLIRHSSNIPYLNRSDLFDLHNYLKMEDVPLWKILLLDSKDFLLRRNYREAIYSINGAFENYLMLKARDRLSVAWGEKNAIEYLEGRPIYKFHNMKDYMDELTFNKAVKDNKINPYVPSTNQILKECHIVHPLSITRKELKSLVNKIRKKRNEVMHGVSISEDLEKISFEAIASFEEFVKVF